MDIKRVKTEIENTLKAYLQKKEDGSYKIPSIRQRPMLLIGPPGIGKTAIMEQVAAECRIGLVAYTITHHTRQSAVGLPFIEKKIYDGKEYSITKYTMSEIIASVYEKIEETKVREGILFLDEINCVSETLAPTMLQFLQCKTFGNQKVPEGWIIVAAGNPPEYNKSVREFDIVTLDRVKRMDVREDYEVWKEYASRRRLHNAILSYLDIKKENFYCIRSSADGCQFVTARGWEDLSELLYAYEELNIPVDYEVVSQYLQQPKIARDFSAYLELYYKYKSDYNVNAILNGDYKTLDAHRLKAAAFDERYGVISLLVDRITGEFCEVWKEDAKVSMLFEMLKTAKQELLSEIEMPNTANQELLSETEMPKTANQELLSETEIPNTANQEPLSETEMPNTRNQEAGIILDRVWNKLCLEEEKREKLPAKDGEKEAFQKALRLFEAFAKEVRLKGKSQPEDAFNLLRERFQSCKEQREQKIVEAGQKLDYCFHFLSDVFGESQELVIFLTQLSLNYYSIEYLGNYGNASYEKYNKELLYTNRRSRILSEIGRYREEINSETL